MPLRLGAWLFYLVLLCIGLRGAEAYETGAPPQTCTSMRPGHGSAASLSYTLKATQTTFSNTSTVDVVLIGTYAGLIMQAQASTCSTPVGTWSKAPVNTKLMTCSTSEDTVTHSNAVAKTDSTFTWIPPKANAPASVVFVATVAKDKSSWVLQLRSNTVTSQGYANISATCGAGIGPTFRSPGYIMWLLPLAVVLLTVARV